MFRVIPYIGCLFAALLMASKMASIRASIASCYQFGKAKILANVTLKVRFARILWRVQRVERDLQN
jgi:hypothetical protein